MTRNEEIGQFARRHGMPKARALKLFFSHSMQPPGYFRVVGMDGNPKTMLGEDLGYLTGIIHFASADASGYEVCPRRTPQCTLLCLGPGSGHGQFAHVQQRRITKTRRWFEEHDTFMASAKHDVFRLLRRAARQRMKAAVRPNGTSDLPKLAWALADEPDFSEVRFYDYTKLPKPWLRTRTNYHLTFSRSGRNDRECREALDHGINVSAVFRDELPDTYWGYPVIDGTTHDLRFLDPSPVIVGLTAKGPRAKADTANEFVILT